MRAIIGVDLGGTQLRVGLAAEDGTLLTELREPTLAEDGPAAVTGQIVELITRVRQQAPADATILGVGIGSPGAIDPFRGIVFFQPNMQHWHDVPLRNLVSERVGLPVELGNDANAAALGEWVFGGGTGTRNLVYVTVSTGIGGGVIVDGRLLLGRYGAAAEVGHQIIDCERRLTWENLAAGPALARAAVQAMQQDATTMLHTLATPDTLTAAHVAQAASAGDPLAVRLFEREGDLIGVGLVNLLFLYSPELILLGGGVVVHNPHLIDRAQTVIQQKAFPVYRDVPVRLAALGDRAGLMGAVALVLHPAEAHT